MSVINLIVKIIEFAEGAANPVLLANAVLTLIIIFLSIVSSNIKRTQRCTKYLFLVWYLFIVLITTVGLYFSE